MISYRSVTSSLVLFLFPSLAAAHVVLTDPVPRSGENGLTMMPCGGVAAGGPTAFMAGDMITVSWEVGQAHGGSLTIDFAAADDMGFRNYVLASELSDEAGMPTSIDVQLPDIDCEACTLRLVQINPDEDDYYSCADISLAGAGGGSTGGDSTGGEADTGGASSEGSSGGGPADGSTGADSGGAESSSGASASATATVTATSASTGDDSSGGSDDSGASDDDSSSGCGCNTTGAPAGWLLLVIAVVAIRPRRRLA